MMHTVRLSSIQYDKHNITAYCSAVSCDHHRLISLPALTQRNITQHYTEINDHLLFISQVFQVLYTSHPGYNSFSKQSDACYEKCLFSPHQCLKKDILSTKNSVGNILYHNH